MAATVRIFVSYAREDEAMARRLFERINAEWPTDLEIWWDRELTAGDLWRPEIAAQIERAHLVLFCVSPDSLSSVECRRELDLALATQGRIAPIILRDADWQNVEAIAKRNVLPTDGRAVSTWSDENRAFDDIIQGLAPALARARDAAPADDLQSQPGNAPRPTLFVGRYALLAAIAEQLHEPRSVVSLYGLPGAGKSALATEIAFRGRHRYPGGVWWIDASHDPIDALLELADDLRMTGTQTVRELLKRVPQDLPRERQAKSVITALQAESKRSLLILDGVNSAAWKALLPGGRVDILSTMLDRQFMFEPASFAIEAGGLSSAEIEQLSDAHASCPPDQRTSRRTVLEEQLAGLPLAVILVSALIRDTGERWNDFEAKLSSGSATEARVDAAIDASLIRAEAFSLEARRLLFAAARFARSPVRLEWIAQTADLQPNDQSVLEAIRRFVQLALVRTIDDGHKRIAMHPLVWRRARALAQKDLSEWKQLSGGVARVVTDWHEEHLDFATLREVDRELPHVREAVAAADESAAPELQIRARNWLASHASERAEYGEAQQRLEEALAIGESNPNARREKFITLTNLGAVLVQTDKLPEAEDALRRAYNSEVASWPAARSAVLGNLGIVRRRRGFPQEALKLLEEALQLREQSQDGVIDHHVERLLGALAAVKATLGERAEALRFAERAVEVASRRLGSTHRGLVDVLSLRGGLLVESGRIEDGIRDLERALRIAEDEYGGESPELYFPLLHLANAKRSAGDFGVARTILERGLQIARQVFGAEHSMSINALINLGVLENERGDPSRAKQLLEEANALDARRPDQTADDRASILNNLGAVSLRLGELDLARERFQQAREAAISVFGRGHPRIAVYDSNLASALLESDPNAALEVALAAIRDAWVALNDIDRAKLLTPVGVAHLLLDRPKKALSALSFARALFEDTVGFAHPSLATALQYEAGALQEVDPARAARAQRRIEELEQGADRSAIHTEAAPVPAEALDAALSEELGRARGAADWRKAARLGLALGKHRIESGAWDSAREVLKNTIRFAERADMPWTLAEAHLTLGDACARAQMIDDARFNYRAAARVFAREPDGAHGQVVALLRLFQFVQQHERRSILDQLSRMRSSIRIFRSARIEVDRILELAHNPAAKL